MKREREKKKISRINYHVIAHMHTSRVTLAFLYISHVQGEKSEEKYFRCRGAKQE